MPNQKRTSKRSGMNKVGQIKVMKEKRGEIEKKKGKGYATPTCHAGPKCWDVLYIIDDTEK